MSEIGEVVGIVVDPEVTELVILAGYVFDDLACEEMGRVIAARPAGPEYGD